MKAGRERTVMVLVSLLSAVAIGLALGLQGYADNRREGVNILTQFQVMANKQSALEWQAIAESSGAVGEIPRIMGMMDFAQDEFWSLAATYTALEKRSGRLNPLFGDRQNETMLSELETSARRYQASVRQTFGQLSTGQRNWAFQTRQNGNPNYNDLWATISAIKERNLSLARKASTTANAATILAALITLIAAGWMVQGLIRVRARRAIELEQARTQTLRESEARFRTLVQHNAGLIAVLDPEGKVRYASPATQSILGLEAEDTVGKNLWEVMRLPQDEKDRLSGQTTSLAWEIRARHAGGEPRELELLLQNHLENPHLHAMVVNAHDITVRKQLERELLHQAMHDPLTDLPNRRFFAASLEKALQESLTAVAVLFVDLEGIKWVNDSFGHDRGDLLLVEAARRVLSCLRSEDTLGRLGGDELVVLLPSVFEENDTQVVASRILGALKLPFVIEGQEVFLTPSIGIAFGDNRSVPGDLVRHAGIAMYQAKREGKTQALVFQNQMGEEAPERLRLESDMRRGLEREEFQVYYQPKVDLQTQKIKSVEALVRWQHPERGLVSPAKFIPFAEETGLIEPLGKMVLETACHDAVAWQKPGEPVVVAVNLSAIQFRNPNLVEEVQEALIRSGLEPEALELEITESAVLGDINSTISILEQLKALGIRLAIDDFGTGYSNLGHLRRFPVDVLKIDQSFVRGPDGFQKPIVEAVIGLAQALELHTVAEGVETQEHMQELLNLGCDMGQGYYFAKPMSGRLIGAMLEEKSGVILEL